MLTVALPDLRHDFNISHAAIGWLVSSYLIAMAVAQPLGGRLGDQLGRSRVFQLGLIAFLGFSIAAAFAPTFPVLVLLRTCQGLVGAAVIPNGMAMLRESVPVDRLGASSGITGSIISSAAAVGPVLGAGLVSAGTWRWLFLVNIPLVLLALGVHALLRYPVPQVVKRMQLDWPGALAFAALLVALTFVLNSLHGGVSVIALALGTTGLVVLGFAFLQRQRTSPSPVAEWRLFRIPSFAAATSYVLFANLVMYTTLLTMPFFIQEFLGGSKRTTGTMLGLLSIISVVLAPITGRFSDARGRRLPAQAGAFIMLGSVLALAVSVSAGMSYVTLGICLAALGFGLGLSFGPASTAAIESAPREFAGAASGTNSMMRYLGSIIGAGILGAVLSKDSGTPDIWLFRIIFIVLLVIAALACASTFFIHRFVRAETPEEEHAGPPLAEARAGAATNA
jgi:EmrB/QacA subfamily drug resistance transporter